MSNDSNEPDINKPGIVVITRAPALIMRLVTVFHCISASSIPRAGCVR